MLSWQGAISHLGNEYATMATNNPFYFETDRQESQIQMLFLKRVDVVQLDEKIFDYFRAKVEQNGIVDTTEEVDRFPLFGASSNGFLFHDKKFFLSNKCKPGYTILEVKFERSIPAWFYRTIQVYDLRRIYVYFTRQP